MVTHLDEEFLSQNFRDITMIYTEGCSQRRIFTNYISINQTRWSRWYNMLEMWPQGNPTIIVLETIYNFSDYKNLGWDITNVDGKNKTHYIRVKFGP